MASRQGCKPEDSRKRKNGPHNHPPEERPPNSARQPTTEVAPAPLGTGNMCRFGAGCKRTDCKFEHPVRPSSSARPSTISQKAKMRAASDDELHSAFVECQQAHQRKIEQLKQRKASLFASRLSKKQSRSGIPLAVFETLTQEREALESKITELSQMTEEFERSALLLFNNVITTSNPAEKKAWVQQLCREIKRLNAGLPAYARRSELLRMLERHQVVVVIGETGSGKSTQIVQFLADAGYCAQGKQVVCTQPRGLAAQALATRVAEEYGTVCGRAVGLRIFGPTRPKVCKRTRILFTTDSMLLRELSIDPLLQRYSCVVVDEAHERSIHTDLLLAFLKGVLQKRSDFRVLVTSATIDEQLFSRYFGGCPIVRISGRMFPVEVHYEPRGAVLLDPQDYRSAVVNKICNIHEKSGTEPGDILVFMPSQEDCEKTKGEVAKALAGVRARKSTGVLPAVVLTLHGSSGPKDRADALKPATNTERRIVIATNIAETSVTIDGVVHVIDTGLAKEIKYDPGCNMEVLELSPITQSSANQRKGRAGRTQPGHCYRLYSLEFFNEQMERHPTPEIQRRHLGMSILTLKEKGISNVLAFDFVQRPDEIALKEALRLLVYLGALESETGPLTEIGRCMARMPTEPMISRMLLAGVELGVSTECLQLAAALSVCDRMFLHFKNNRNKTDAVTLKKMEFDLDGGDMVNFLLVFRNYLAVPRNKRISWCKQHHIHPHAMINALEAYAMYKRGLRAALAAHPPKPKQESAIPRKPTAVRTPEPLPDNDTLSEISDTSSTSESSTNSDQSEIEAEYEDFENQLEIEEGEEDHIDDSAAPPSPTAAATSGSVESAMPAADSRFPSVKCDLTPTQLENIRRAICKGFFINTCRRDLEGRYMIMRLRQLAHIHPKSFPCTRDRPPQWIVYVELQRTNPKREYIKVVSQIEKHWVATDAPDFAAQVRLADEDELDSFVIGPLPSAMVAFLLGADGSNRQQLQQKWRAAIDIEGTPARARITAFKRSIPAIRSELQAMLERAKRIFAREVAERNVAGTRIAVGPGGEVQILGPNDTLVVRLKNIPTTVAKEELWDFVESVVGKDSVCRISVIKDYGESGSTSAATKCQANVTFTSPAMAARGAEQLNNRFHFGVQLTAELYRESTSASGGEDTSSVWCCSLKVSWINATCKGPATVEFEQPINPSFAKQQRSISIGGQSVQIYQAKDKMKNVRNDALKLKGLPPQTDEYDVRQSLLPYIGSLAPIKKVKLWYNTPNEAALKSELDMFIAKFQSLFQQYGELKTIDLFPEKLTKKAPWAQVTFTNGAAAAAAVRGLDGQTGILGVGKVRVCLQPSSSLFLEDSVYDKLKPFLDEKIGALKQRFPDLKIRMPNNTKISLSAATNVRSEAELTRITREIALARSELRKEICKIVGIQRRLQKALLQKVEAATGTCIVNDVRRQRLTIYGPAANREEAVEQLKELEKEQLENSEMVEVRPRVIAWLNREGRKKLSDKYKDCKLELELVAGKGRLLLRGPPEQRTALKAALQQQSNALYKAALSKSGAAASAPMECGTCFTATPEDSRGVLLLCGHFTCEDCFTMQLRQESASIRLQCTQCNEKLAYADVFVHSRIPTEQLSSLDQKLLEKFVSTNHKSFGYCEECGEAVVRKGQGAVTCPNPQCGTRLCGTCLEAFHVDTLCASEKAELEKLKFANMRHCPHCKRLQERTSGCNAMVCVYCRGYYCWLCVRGFKEDAHRHFGDPQDPCFGKLFEGCGGVYG